MYQNSTDTSVFMYFIFVTVIKIYKNLEKLVISVSLLQLVTGNM